MTAPCAPWCGASPEEAAIEGPGHWCTHVVGVTGGVMADRVAVDLVQRFNPHTQVVERQIGVVDQRTGMGVAFTLDRLPEVLALVEQARHAIASATPDGDL